MEIGNRVIATYAYDRNNDIVNKTGTIIYMSSTQATVQFDQRIERGHSGSGVGEHGYCWSIPFRYLELVEDTKDKLAKALENRAITIAVNGKLIIIKTQKKKHIATIQSNKKVVYGDLKTKTELEYKSIIEGIIGGN